MTYLIKFRSAVSKLGVEKWKKINRIETFHVSIQSVYKLKIQTKKDLLDTQLGCARQTSNDIFGQKS